MKYSITATVLLTTCAISHAGPDVEKPVAEKTAPEAPALCEYKSGDKAQMKSLRASCWTVPGIGLKMRRIPAGRFVMGSGPHEMHRRGDEKQREVTISRPFYMGVCEVTQRQFYDVMLPADYDYDDWQYKRGPLHDSLAFCYRYETRGGLIFRHGAVGGALTDDHPMECVTWDRAREFCRNLTRTERKAGRLPDGYVYRLPTEAQWEYACRAGTTGPYNVEGDYSTLKGLNEFAFVRKFHPVRFGTDVVGGGRRPNAWGLYDMHGNVYEWCRDWYGPYQGEEATDPTGPDEGDKRVARGGCFAAWTETADMKRINMPRDKAEDKLGAYVHPFLRSASRYSFRPDINFYAILGFRVVLAEEIE